MYKNPAWRGRVLELDSSNPFSEPSTGSFEKLEKSPLQLPRPPLASRTKKGNFTGDFQVSRAN